MSFGGYYVMTYGGGRYTSVAWCATREAAETIRRQIINAGAGSGMPPKIEPGKPASARLLTPRNEQASTCL